MRILIFILTLLLIPQQALAIPDIPLDVNKLDISFERHSHNSVIASAQDSQGYIWLASIRGLHVYDGRSIRPVLDEVLQGNNIRDIRIDANDVLWVGTNSGVLAYHLATKTPQGSPPQAPTSSIRIRKALSGREQATADCTATSPPSTNSRESTSSPRIPKIPGRFSTSPKMPSEKCGWAQDRACFG
jgi:ligand-binding sensor domain-containing protein